MRFIGPLVLTFYLAFAFLTYGCEVGDIQYNHTQYPYATRCPSAEDYARGLSFGLMPLCWPGVAVVSIGHLLNEGHIPFTLKIHVRGCA